MYSDTVLSDGTVLKAETQNLFLTLAMLAQSAGEATAHGEDPSQLLMSLGRTKALFEDLPFELAMAASTSIMGYVEVAKNHSVARPACNRCNGEEAGLSELFWDSGLAADLADVLENHLASA